jgi:hypothetical protein
MVSKKNRLLDILLVFGLVSCGLGGCSSSDNGSGSTGGTPSTGGVSTGGVASTGGVSTGGVASTGGVGSGGTGGVVATGGKTGTGGSTGSGGKTGTGGATETGGSTASGGTTSSGGSTGSGGIAATGGQLGGSTGSGGSPGKDGGVAASTGSGGTTASTGGGGAGGAPPAGGAGGSTSGGCQKGQVKAKEVVIMGESFYAMDPKYIEKRIEDNAKKAGAIGSGDSYRNVAISGQPMSVVAGKEWDDAVAGGTTKVVIMDGGGIDCMSSSCSSCPDTFKTLLGKMATAGVQQVIYTRYPEPGNPPGSNATLKGNLDTLMPKMQPVCEGATGLKCHWVDLRPVWVNGDTSDGLHPTQSGGDHVGDLIWAEMVKDCIAQ